MILKKFNEEFALLSAPLKSYLLRMTASVDDCEDLLQDTYLKASEKLDSFREESSLKTWVFAIATNLAKDNQRFQKRWTEDITDIAREAVSHDKEFYKESMQIMATSEQANFEIKEHIAFCFTCISKSLPLEQQLCIFLKEVYEFKVSEIATILETTEPMVKYYLHTGRSKMIDVFDNRCALINKQGICDQCSEINGLYNPKQNAQQELVKIELVKQAEQADKEKLFDLRMHILQELDPFQSKAAALQLHHLEYNRRLMEK